VPLFGLVIAARRLLAALVLPLVATVKERKFHV
jgi:hypothetical protein